MELAFLWEIIKHLRRMADRDAEHKMGERYYITVIYKDGPVSWMWQDHKYGVATLHKENREPKTEVSFENPLLFQVDDGVLTKGSGYDFIDCLQLLTEIRRYTILDVLADV